VVAFGLVIQFQGGLTIVSSQRFDIMGVLALFLCLNAFIGRRVCGKPSCLSTCCTPMSRH
jgi:hypothetical protein